MDNILEILSKFNYTGIILVTILTSFLLSAINKTMDTLLKRKNDVNNAIIITLVVLVLTVLISDFTTMKTFLDYQMAAFQVISTWIISYLLSITKGQELVDSFLSFVSRVIVAIFTRLKKIVGIEDSPEDKP